MSVQILDGPLRRWHDPSRSIATKIWRVGHGDTPYAVFCNGHFLIAVPELVPDAAARPEMPEHDRVLAERVMRDVAAAKRSAVTTQSLMACTLGAPPERWPECDACDGTGGGQHECAACGHTHTCVCTHCTDGRLVPERKIVEIEDDRFDQRYVAEVVHALAQLDAPIAAAVGRQPSDDPNVRPWITFDCAGVLAVVIGLRPDPDVFPHFRGTLEHS